MTRVLVVDDEPQLTLALESALAREGYEVLTADDGVQAVEIAATAVPDLIVLDLDLPGLHGLQVIERLRPWLQAPVLVLSGTSQSRLKAQALDAGADDYLEKPFGLDELLARLRALARRRTDVAQVATTHRFGGLVVDFETNSTTVDGAEVHLTRTEWRLLRQLVANPDRLLTHRWLLGHVWDSTHGDETREALRTHVRTLRSKIGDDARAPRFIRTESGSGYRWIGAADATPTAEAGRGRTAPDDRAPDPAHELASAVTALRMAVQLLVRSEEAVPDAVREAYVRLDDLTRRVSDLIAARADGSAP